MVSALQGTGLQVELVSFLERTASELRQAADQITDLDAPALES